jgi:hypothetical protein
VIPQPNHRLQLTGDARGYNVVVGWTPAPAGGRQLSLLR